MFLLLSHSIMPNSLQPHGLQHARLPCPSLSSRVCSNSRPLSRCCHPTISSSVTLFSSCPQSFPVSGSFPMSWLFVSGGQSTGIQFQHQSFQGIFRVDFLQDQLVWSLCCGVLWSIAVLKSRWAKVTRSSNTGAGNVSWSQPSSVPWD